MPIRQVRLNIQGKTLSHLTHEAWQSILVNNDPPLIYRYGTALARIIDGPNGEPIIEHITYNTLRGLVDTTAFWFKPNRGRDAQGQPIVNESPVFPVKDVVYNMIGTPHDSLPTLKGITNVPAFATNGALQINPGYSLDTQLYYHPNFKRDIPHIPANPTRADMLAARNLILDDLIHDFPFDYRQNDEAYILAMLFQPFIRNLIDGFTPFYLIDKPQAGTGASLLAQSIISVVTGGDMSSASSMDLSGGEFEVSKKLLATFSTSPTVIFIDNVVGELASKRLTETITSHYYADRVLGSSKIAHYPVRNLWIATGNNPKMSADMVRRTIRIRLNADMEKPELRADFKHPNLDIWVSTHIPELIHACLVMIQYWISQGKPLTPVLKGGGFESWSQIMGGIMSLLELDKPFLSNAKEMHQFLDDDSLSWKLLLQAWHDKFQNRIVSSSDIADLIEETESDVFVYNSNNRLGFLATVGKQLSLNKDKMYGNYRIQADKSHNNSKRWKLGTWEKADI